MPRLNEDAVHVLTSTKENILRELEIEGDLNLIVDSLPITTFESDTDTSIETKAAESNKHQYVTRGD